MFLLFFCISLCLGPFLTMSDDNRRSCLYGAVLPSF